MRRLLIPVRAFTLVELMIVIGIIGIMIVFVAQIAQDQTPAIDRERSSRFANAIANMLSTTYSSMYLGKGVYSESELMYPDIANIIFDSSGKILSEYRYASGNILISSGVLFQYPFFDQDSRYGITSFVTCSSGSVSSPFTGGIIEFRRSAVSFTGLSNITTGTLVEIGVLYRNVSRFVSFDRRVGRTEIKNTGICQ